MPSRPLPLPPRIKGWLVFQDEGWRGELERGGDDLFRKLSAVRPRRN